MTETNRVYLENVRDLMHRPGEMRERERDVVTPEHFGEGLAVVPEGETIHLDMRLESVHEGILATVVADIRYVAECGRCLTEFAAKGKVDFTELFAYTPTEADEYGVHGDHVNLEPPLRDAIVLALPFQPVCRPDCLGLNPETGEKRTAEEVADAEQIIDPRWAALAEFQADHERVEGETAPNENK
ncbi:MULTISPECIES: YceD family protein [Leucobacter]|uniref:YceD family protein n=1 Tax=Leucobacter TaxID=55968 RepID=UPI0022EA97DC|nr:DUF177 domain-containing protein [Leucobacter sp. UCMA 4100]